MHRAYALLRLLSRRAQQDHGRPMDAFVVGVARELARGLAAAYGALATGRDDERVPCSALLMDIVLNLGALFCGRAVVVTTMIERIPLPG